MAYIKFSAIQCNKLHEKAIKNCSPTLKHVGRKVTITIETLSEPTDEYINKTEKLLEETPLSSYEYFINVRCISIQK